MKNLFCLFLFIMALGVSPLTAQESISLALNSTTKAMKTVELVSWNQTEIDLGQIPQDVPAPATFIITNESKQVLLLKNVKGSCGCTATDYDTQPINPGQSSKIVATYNAKKAGRFSKTVSVSTNLEEAPIILHLRGEVITE